MCTLATLVVALLILASPSVATLADELVEPAADEALAEALPAEATSEDPAEPAVIDESSELALLDETPEPAVEEAAAEPAADDASAEPEVTDVAADVTPETAAEKDSPFLVAEVLDAARVEDALAGIMTCLSRFSSVTWTPGELVLLDLTPTDEAAASATSPSTTLVDAVIDLPEGWDAGTTHVFVITAFDVLGIQQTLAEEIPFEATADGIGLAMSLFDESSTVALVQEGTALSVSQATMLRSPTAGTSSNPLIYVSAFSDVTARTSHWRDIEWLYEAGITTGWTSGGKRYYRGSNNILRQDMAAFLFRLAKLIGVVTDSWQPSASDKEYFVDVDESTPHHDEIWWLAHAGISTGWENEDGTRTFRGESTVTRQDMSAFLFRLAKLAGMVTESWQPSTSDKTYFSDVSTSTPHYREVLWLASTGISKGWTASDGTHTFRGGNSIVRKDMAAFLHRLAEPYSDNTTYYELGVTLETMLSYQTFTASGVSVNPTASQLDPNAFVGTSGYYQFCDNRGYTGLTGAQLDAYIGSSSLGRSGVLYGHGSTIVAACRYYNLNEAYLLSHMILESAWGTSYYARQANPNLIGWGAYDTNPDECMAYAAQEGWTSVDGSIWGAAKVLCNNYIYDGQPTLYEMRWQAFKSAQLGTRYWYQYCTSTTWPTSIANIMGSLYQSANKSPDVYYLVPVYK